jgi:hypothetical protein
MGNEKDLFERWDAWQNKHPILRWVFYVILAYMIFVVKNWFEDEPDLNVKSETIAEQGEVIVELINWPSSKESANKETRGSRAHSQRAIEIDAARSELPYIINYSSGNSITAERDFMKRAFSGISEYDNELEERRIRNWQCIFKGGMQSKEGEGYLVDNVVWGRLPLSDYNAGEPDYERFNCYTPHLFKGGKLDRKGLISLTALTFAGVNNFSGFFPIRVYVERDITKVIGPDTIYINDEIFINGTVSCAVRSGNMGCAVAASEIRFIANDN